MFDMRQEDAAKSLGISVSTLKHACRQLGIPRWPFKNSTRASRPATSSSTKATEAGSGFHAHTSFTSAHLEQVRYSGALHAVRATLSSGEGVGEGEIERSSVAFQTLRAAAAAHLSGEGEEEGPIEHASARLPRPMWHEIWRRSNLNNNGLLDEAMDTI